MDVTTSLLSPYVPPSGSDDVAGNVSRILQTIRSHLRMDVAFVSEFLGGRRTFRHVNTATEESSIQVGDSSPLEDGYCQRVVDGRLPELIPDTAEVPEAMALPVTCKLPVGAHLSVPLRLSDGRVYGTFCCFSFAPDRSLNDRDLQMMRAFAELAAHQIEHDLMAKHRRDEQITRIRRVIEREQFSAVYQPIYNLADDRVAGLECLTRFPGPPSLPPNLWFLEAAEAGFRAELELAAVRLALTAMTSLPPDLYLAINVSPATVLSGGLEVMLEGVPLERIVLEITEHEVITAYTDLMHTLRPLRERGLRVAIDDAGAGYASMHHILKLEPDLIKLDMSLTRDIDSDPARRALASALIVFAREIGSQIIAEGVETASELFTLRTLGMNKAQGYLLGRPVPLEQVSSYSSS